MRERQTISEAEVGSLEKVIDNILGSDRMTQRSTRPASRRTAAAQPPPQAEAQEEQQPDQDYWNEEDNNEQPTQAPLATANPPAKQELIGQDGELIQSNRAMAIRGFSAHFADSPYTQDFEDEPQGMGGYYLNIAQSQSDPVLNEFKDSNGNSWLGQLYLSGSSLDENAEEFDSPAAEIIAVPIAGAAKRQKWVQDGNKRTLQCWAVGPRFSELHGEGNPGGECKTCEFSQWVTGPDGKRTTGCNRTYSYVMYIPDWDEICIWDLSSTSATVGREFLKWCQARGWANFAVTIWATQVTSTDYGLSDDGTAILLSEDSKAVKPVQGQGRQRQAQGNRWFTPECQILEGTLEENGISLPMAEDDNSDFQAGDDLPF